MTSTGNSTGAVQRTQSWHPDDLLKTLRIRFLKTARAYRGSPYFASYLNVASEYGRESRKRRKA